MNSGFSDSSRAQALRRNMTDAEKRLWRHLRDRQVAGAKFRRQVPVGPYVVDFMEYGARLIVEVDGGQHMGSAEDEARTRWLERSGFRVIRFWNHEVLTETDAVLTRIAEALQPSSGPLSPGGRGRG